MGQSVKKINNVLSVGMKMMDEHVLLVDKLALATKGLSAKNTLLMLSQKGVSSETAKQVLVARKVSEKEIEQALATSALSASQVTATGTTFSFSSALKGLVASIGMSTIALAGAVTAIAAIGIATYKWAKSDEKALEKSKEKLNGISSEYNSIGSEVESLKTQILSLNEQINNLNPITDNEQIEKLKEERAEIEQEVALLKQRHDYLAEQESNAAKESLEKTSSSKYSYNNYNNTATAYTEDAYTNAGIVLGHIISNKGVSDQVTQYEELALAMDRVNDLEKQRKELKEEQANLNSEDDNYDTDYNELKAQIENIDSQIVDVKGDANTLATSVQSDWSKLQDGELKDYIGEILIKYFEFSDAVDVATSSFNALSKAQQKNILIGKLQEKGLDESQIEDIMSNFSPDDYVKLYSKNIPSMEVIKKTVEAELEALEKGGSVDLNIRPKIDTSELNKKGWDAGEGTATVFSSTYSNEDGTVAINFTPIMTDSNGNYKGVLSPDELEQYALEVISGTREDDLKLQIGSAFTGEYAIQEAEKSAIRIHELHEKYLLDENSAESYGEAFAKAWLGGYKKEFAVFTKTTFVDVMENINSLSAGFDQLDSIMADIINGEDFDYSSILNNEDFKEAFGEYKEEYDAFIETITNSPDNISKCQDAFDNLATAYIYGSGALNDLTEESKNAVILDLEQMGVKNATEIVNDALSRYAEVLKIAEANNIDLTNATVEDISTMIEQGDILEENAITLFNYALQKQLCSENSIDTVADCQQLLNLAKQAGATAEVIELLIKLQNSLNVISSSSWGDATKELAKKEAERITAQLKTMSFVDYSKADFGGGSASKQAGKEAGDAYVEAFEKELKSLQLLRDSGEITEKEYLERLRVLYEKYFKDRKEYLDEFKKYEKEYLEGMESLYNSAISGITKLLDKRIDAINKEKDAILEALEEEKDARLEALESQIDAKQAVIDGIQKEIDKMQEANDERKRQIDLQKAQYDLERLQNQKTQLIYKDGQMVYETDSSGIRDAREEVADAKFEIEVAQKEKQISLLEEEIELLEKQRESVENYYDKMIEQQEKYFDSLIKNLETQKSKWEELAEIKEVAEAYSAIEQVFGDLGYTVEDVLNGSEGAFEDFKSKYLTILSEMNSNTSFGEGLSYAVGELDKSLGKLGSNTEGLDTLTSKIGEVEDSVTSVANAISGAGGSTGASGGGKGEESGSTGGTTSSLKKALEEQTTEALTKIDEQSNAFAEGEDSLKGSVEQVISKVAGGSKATEGGGLATGKNGGAARPGESSGDTSNLMGAIQAQTAAALDEEAGIPAQKQAWTDLNTPLGESNNLVLSIKQNLEAMDGKEFTVTLNVNGGSGFDFHSITGKFNGTANVSGTANIHGNWGLKEDTRSLVGELGREIVVRNDRFFTVGDNGAEFVNLKRGDIVFNHRQTEDLLKNGRISTRGKAFAQGNYTPLEFANPEKFSMLQKIGGLNKGLDKFIDNISKFNTMFDSTIKNVNNIKNISNAQDINISIGDINLTGVQDVDGLVNAIKTKLPNVLLQTMTKR